VLYRYRIGLILRIVAAAFLFCLEHIMIISTAWRPSTSHTAQGTHSRNLGLLWTAVHSLETALRLFTLEQDGSSNAHLTLIVCSRAGIGDEFELNAYTKKLQLDKLIIGYNSSAAAHGFDSIDLGIVELRHALAHGRVTSIGDDAPIRILNFRPQPNGKLVVCFAAVLTDEWVADQCKRIDRATHLVHELGQAVKYSRR
jgi:hypothetical protein